MPETRTTAARRCRLFGGALALALLPACSSVDRGGPVDFAETPAFSGSGPAALAGNWWTAFDDASLNDLVDRALAGNFELAAVRERLRAAEAVVDRAESGFLPDVDGLGEAESTRSEGEDSDRLLLGLAAEYEVDLWGRIRSQVAAERFRAEAARGDYQTAAISLSGQVALAWFQAVEANSQVALLEAQVETNETAVQSLQNRFEAGQARAADTLRQKQLLEATRERLSAARSRLAVLTNQLAVLTGQPAQGAPGFAAGAAILPELPPLPSTGLPAGLVQRRPDVRAAFFRLQAADREVAAAVANRFPRLSLSAGLDTTESDARELFEDWTRSLAANLIAPVIDGGERRAEVERTAAVRRQRLNEYAQTVLTAFREVEDALVRERLQARQIESLEAQVRLAHRASDRIRDEFANGVGDFLDLLTARTEAQRLERDRLAARRALVEFRIALYRALAGPIPRPLESADNPRGSTPGNP